jgi:hypothetical protein
MPFAKGQSGNPSGRKKEDPELKEACRKLTAQLIKRLLHWANQDEDPGASVKAIGILLDRGHGKAVESLEVSGKNGAPLTPVFNVFIKGSENK